MIFFDDQFFHFIHLFQLARTYYPERVVALEEEWGDSLVAELNHDAAINHFLGFDIFLVNLDWAKKMQWLWFELELWSVLLYSSSYEQFFKTDFWISIFWIFFGSFKKIVWISVPFSTVFSTAVFFKDLLSFMMLGVKLKRFCC